MTLIYMIFTLGIMVVVHELGHFLTAKLFKIGVPIFSIGMGKKLFGIKWKKTDYIISMLPFGGYVKLKGMEDFDREQREDDDFMSKHPLKRVAVIFAGPFANLILSFVLLLSITMLFGISYMPNSSVWSVGGPYESYFIKGDSIAEVNGKSILYYTDIFKNLKPNEVNHFSVLRNKNITRISFRLDKPDSLLIFPIISTKVGLVTKNSPAMNAGLKEGDIITRIDSFKVDAWQLMSQIIRESYDKEIEVAVLRGGEEIILKLTPEKREDENKNYYGIIGVGYSSEIKKPSIAEGVLITFERVNYIALQIVKFLGQLMTGRMSVKNLGGPISIYSMTGESLKWGFDSFLAFVAFFSMNLFIFNLIPFPPLDGSYITIFIFETVTGKRATSKFMMIYQQVGFVTLMALIALVSFNDILRIFVR